MASNPIIQDLLNMGSVNDEVRTLVLTGLDNLRKIISGLSDFSILLSVTCKKIEDEYLHMIDEYFVRTGFIFKT